jgi:hypothetical protein
MSDEKDDDPDFAKRSLEFAKTIDRDKARYSIVPDGAGWMRIVVRVPVPPDAQIEPKRLMGQQAMVEFRDFCEGFVRGVSRMVQALGN